jgi:hypothetical protein
MFTHSQVFELFARVSPSAVLAFTRSAREKGCPDIEPSGRRLPRFCLSCPRQQPSLWSQALSLCQTGRDPDMPENNSDACIFHIAMCNKGVMLCVLETGGTEMKIEKTLASAFGFKFGTDQKVKRSNAADYTAFHAECKKRGITYKIDRREGYIRLSSGESFPHYNWGETLDRLMSGNFNQ